MITAIEIENFKGIRDRVGAELKPITLLFGANSSVLARSASVVSFLADAESLLREVGGFDPANAEPPGGHPTSRGGRRCLKR